MSVLLPTGLVFLHDDPWRLLVRGLLVSSGTLALQERLVTHIPATFALGESFIISEGIALVTEQLIGLIFTPSPVIKLMDPVNVTIGLAVIGCMMPALFFRQILQGLLSQDKSEHKKSMARFASGFGLIMITSILYADLTLQRVSQECTWIYPRTDNIHT